MVNLQEKPCQSPGEIISRVNSLELDDDCREDFDAESILDEEIDEGIDSIMGCRVEGDSNGAHEGNNWSVANSTGFGFGGKMNFRLGLVRALRRVDEGNWWNFPPVDIVEISPRINKHTTSFAASANNEKVKEKKKKTATTTTTTKKKKKAEKAIVELKSSELPREDSIPKLNSSGLLLKLNYDDVLNAWSDRGSPFADGSPGSDAPGNDATVRFPSLAGRSKSKNKNKKVWNFVETRKSGC